MLGQVFSWIVGRPELTAAKRSPSNRAPFFESVVVVAQLTFSLPLHLPKLSRLMPRRSSRLSRPAFFCRSFFRALLQANSCVRQLRGLYFSGSALNHRVPSHKAAARFGSSSPRFWVPQKMGQKKDTFSCPTYMLSGLAFGVVHSPTVPSLEHGLSSLATPGTEARDAAGGALRPEWRGWPAARF